MTTPPSSPAQPACPLCAGTSFRTELTRIPGRWWQSQHRHRLTMRVCERCSYVLFFAGRRGDGGRYDAGTGGPDRPDGAVL